MHTHDDLDDDRAHRVSTGALPSIDDVRRLVAEAHERYAGLDDGAVADYIPALAAVDPALFGISVVGVEGRVVSVGDATHPFSLQSVSKPFVFALVLPGDRREPGRASCSASTGPACRSTRSWRSSSTTSAR